MNKQDRISEMIDEDTKSGIFPHSHCKPKTYEQGKAEGRKEVYEEILKGLYSENDTIQLRAIIASIEAEYYGT